MIVGLPYSLYASVRFAEDMTKEIFDEQNNSSAKNVRLGSVSYIAHSLHMFLDEASLKIVRSIVHEVSY